ncbi:MAG: tyrosine phosphatase family protein [Nitrospira sp.]
MASPLLPYRITICGLTELAAHATSGFSHVISILDPEWLDPEDFEGYGPHRRVVYRFDDVVEVRAGVTAPNERDVEALLDFGRMLAKESVDRLLIHCHAGVSRSTAAAIILMAQNNRGREDEVFAELARLRPRSWPNALMVGIADGLLDRGGTLVAELRKHQRQMVRDHPEFAEILVHGVRAHELVGPDEDDDLCSVVSGR